MLTGPNGAGKTNLLEALSFLAPGRGLRRARLAEVGRLGADAGVPWAVAAVLATPEGPTEIGTASRKLNWKRMVGFITENTIHRPQFEMTVPAMRHACPSPRYLP